MNNPSSGEDGVKDRVSMNNWLPIISITLPLLTAAVTLGISIGIIKAKIATFEKHEKDMQIRFTDDIKLLKDEYIQNNTKRIKEFEIELRKRTEIAIRFEEKLTHWTSNIDKRLDMLGEKLEKRQ